MKLQLVSIITLFHEHIHSIHDISTMVGITKFYFEAVNCAVFSTFTDVSDRSSCQEITSEPAIMFKGVMNANAAILGGPSNHNRTEEHP